MMKKMKDQRKMAIEKREIDAETPPQIIKTSQVNKDEKIQINGRQHSMNDFMEIMKGTLVMDDEDMDRAQPMYSFTSGTHVGGQN